MEDKKRRVNIPRKVPTLDDEVIKACDGKGVYTVKLPQLENSVLELDGEKVCKTI